MVVALLFCLYFALPKSITTLRFGAGPSAFSIHGRDPILIFGLIAATFIAASIASRSPLVADRVVFGVAAASFLLALIRELFLPISWAASIITGLHSILWTIAALVTLALVITTSRFPQRIQGKLQRDDY